MIPQIITQYPTANHSYPQITFIAECGRNCVRVGYFDKQRYDILQPLRFQIES